LSAGGRVLAIGTPGGGEGRVRIYEYISGNWTQIGSDIDGEAALDRSGTSVSLSSEGNIVAIGAPSNSDGGISSGHVRIYENISGVWTQIGSDIDGDAVGDLSGTSVSLSSEGNIVAIGAPQGDGLGNSSKNGYVRVFENNSGVWTQIGVDIDGEAVGDLSGSSVSLSSDGKTVAIGAPYNDGNGNNSGHVRVYELRPPSSSSNNFISDSFEVYPNPVSDVLNIRMKNNLSLEKVTIYNNSGQIVKTAQQNTVDISNLSSGIYFVEVTTNQGKAVKKIIVK
ncbi:MAG TPA: T9SS type A sorting domain-containing protein, partial [Flavobacterium sp.]|nr:T9SS type A sorting domain-containing protein [Flavobacterium sp.]